MAKGARFLLMTEAARINFQNYPFAVVRIVFGVWEVVGNITFNKGISPEISIIDWS